MDEMEYTELRAKLESLEAEQKEVERVIAAKRDQRKAELISEFKQKIKEEGFNIGEIADAFAGRRTTRRAGGARSYPRYVDNADSSFVYVRGPLPSWMKERMAAVGLNPAEKGDRERYKQDYMHADS
ncbi:H-NS histone family protein [Thiorhodovibrio frisius]|uniref:DNA-binding protein H-NS n=1 Tax=Thiorhodovibrio frisius TaxID=631362 RepID=H8Z084_9GAMM|nr:H-NS histone family protein [Thiorhodovibrio frisius]EIC22292.1 DNA-binding protein H-NS [Thiorhodovibrio frisius]WPL24586.1 H-NS histone family protein [Thiorhodovibrio frisius]